MKDYAGLDEFPADIRQGSKRDAILFSVGANANHGMRRTNEDKRKAVMTLGKDEEWALWVDAEIARCCSVSQPFVSKLRPLFPSYNGYKMEKDQVRKAKRNGKEYTIDTTKIGKSPAQPEPAPDLFGTDLEDDILAEEWAWTFNPETQVARCKYCYEQHDNWIQGTRLDFDQPVWICNRCDHATSDENIEDVLSIEEWQAKQDEYDEDNLPGDEAEEPQPISTSYPISIINADAQYLSQHITDPVHLIITSPPYNVGIDYDQHNDSLLTYIPLITSVWRECFKVMADGARIAVVVPFGVGRNPYIPFDCQIMQTLTEAGFILRGRIVWDKNTTGNRTSWGSYRMASSPSLRDTTECIIVAHKGSGTLDIPAEHKGKDDKGSYTPWLVDSDYFMELAQDHWVIGPESAQRVKHPAPFPTELVKRLIHFYGFPGCHVVDPFGGSGTVGVAAKALDCQATLFEISQDYCSLAEGRIHDQ